MYMTIKNDKINGYYITIGATVRHDRPVFEVSASKMQDESRCGYPLRERTTADKVSAIRTYNYYRGLAKKGEF